MSHHSNDDPLHPLRDDDDGAVRKSEIMRKLMDTTGFRGAIGSYPEGKISMNDEGAIQFGLKAQDGKVFIDFGTPVRSLGMNPQQAADFASDLLKLARAAGRAKGETVAFKIG